MHLVVLGLQECKKIFTNGFSLYLTATKVSFTFREHALKAFQVLFQLCGTVKESSIQVAQ